MAEQAEDGGEGGIEFVIKWNGADHAVVAARDETIADIKRRLGEMTRVLPKRQKLMGLKGKDGKMAVDTTIVGDLKYKAGAKVMMMGSPEDVIEQTNYVGGGGSEVMDDLQMAEDDFAALEPNKDPVVMEKLERRLRSVDVKILNPARPGKKLLVIDIDYTIFDLGSQAERPMDLARPHLHKFLTAVYEFYDIVIWSANSMKWMDVKMTALGVLGHADFKVTFMLDFRAMLTVHTASRGVFDCKPLQFIWSKFGDRYTPDNTVMLDDLRRNYIMNKQNGLVIRAFTKAHRSRATDRELVGLKYYLTLVGSLESMAHLNHKRWEMYMLAYMPAEERERYAADMATP